MDAWMAHTGPKHIHFERVEERQEEKKLYGIPFVSTAAATAAHQIN